MNAIIDKSSGCPTYHQSGFRSQFGSASSKGSAISVGYSHTDAYRALANLQGTMSEILDQAGMTDAFLAQNCLKPLLNATQLKICQYKGKVKDVVEVADTDARIRALDIALRIKGKYAPLPVEQAHKHAVKVLILDVPRPKRDIPPPTMIGIAKPEFPPTKGNGHNGNESSGGAKSGGLEVRNVGTSPALTRLTANYLNSIVPALCGGALTGSSPSHFWS
jgi:hypothetical protein